MFSYLDTSALVKLVVAEAETDALIAWVEQRHDHLATSLLARAELQRAVRRTAPDLLERAREVLGTLHLLGMPSVGYDEAARLEPAALRTLDALHLASALRLEEQLEAIISYDERLNDAARLLGITVLSPE
ncbi:type II toxin-antitoxin system VapC family toxin [Protaetiibacter larvae]|uniref:Ribonuclease VapC n=1 Tax=Protaetiibacter larvae TaxID=2592654 RepID=A0A5C1Y752_9MICO|nr:type II toxin-antitoxin system VapC family toxin [Protaetiibacter larvae]QEO09764.1 type II toxin-antitoxin system VapC family toxin [Protaetiibacter larvae]